MVLSIDSGINIIFIKISYFYYHYYYYLLSIFMIRNYLIRIIQKKSNAKGEKKNNIKGIKIY